MPHEASWRAWLGSVAGLVPIEAASATLCRPQQPHCYTPAPAYLPHISQVRLAAILALQGVHLACDCPGKSCCWTHAQPDGHLRKPWGRAHDGVTNPLLQEPAGLMGQHLFSVYVHPGQRHPGYPPGNLFHGREVPNRVQVRGWRGVAAHCGAVTGGDRSCTACELRGGPEAAVLCWRLFRCAGGSTAWWRRSACCCALRWPTR